MTPRERVRKTLNFQEPDRVPMDLGGMKASGIASIAYDRLKKELNLDGPTKVIDPRFMIAHIDEPIRRRFHLDVIPLDWSTAFYLDQPDEDWVPRRLFDGTEVLLPPGTGIQEDAEGNWILLAPDGSPTSYRMPKDGFYFDDCAFNETGGIDPRKFKPICDIPSDRLDLFARHAKRLYDETDYALLGWGFGVCFLGMSLITERSDNVTLGQPDEWLMMLLTEKETCHEMMNRSVDASIQCLKLVHQAVGDRCFAWGIAADDSGTQRGEFIRPELWAEMIKPHYRRLCDWIHANTGWKTFFHCCGSVYNLIPHLIEAGIDILNPVQTSAANMDPATLKREFGRRIVFWGGGCDTQHVLDKSSPEEIHQHVRERLEVFAPGGGYVFTQVHNVQPNIPPDNVIAMFDAAYEFGKYRT